MSKLTNGIPDFLYKPAAVNLDLLPGIRKEAFKLFLELQKKWLKEKIFYYVIDFEQEVGKIQDLCPTLTAELQRLGLYDYFYSLLFVQKLPSQHAMPIHRDANLDTPYVYGHLGLNIPIAGCENSFTVFYDGELDKNFLDAEKIPKDNPWYGTYSAQLGGKFADQHSVKEIDRVQSNQPLWLNTYAFHAGRTESLKPRLLLSLRFYDLSNLFESGYFDEHLVAKEAT